jgi:hypothetical protein
MFRFRTPLNLIPKIISKVEVPGIETAISCLVVIHTEYIYLMTEFELVNDMSECTGSHLHDF